MHRNFSLMLRRIKVHQLMNTSNLFDKIQPKSHLNILNGSKNRLGWNNWQNLNANKSRNLKILQTKKVPNLHLIVHNEWMKLKRIPALVEFLNSFRDLSLLKVMIKRTISNFHILILNQDQSFVDRDFQPILRKILLMIPIPKIKLRNQTPK